MGKTPTHYGNYSHKAWDKLPQFSCCAMGRNSTIRASEFHHEAVCGHRRIRPGWPVRVRVAVRATWRSIRQFPHIRAFADVALPQPLLARRAERSGGAPGRRFPFCANRGQDGSVSGVGDFRLSRLVVRNFRPLSLRWKWLSGFGVYQMELITPACRSRPSAADRTLRLKYLSCRADCLFIHTQFERKLGEGDSYAWR